eukprot:COSAG06_NODE_48225_length_333_cov_1.487179_2_plen_39_part_01
MAQKVAVFAPLKHPAPGYESGCDQSIRLHARLKKVPSMK